MVATRMLLCFCVLTSTVSASTITISSIGINSLGLRDAQGDLLTGAGIAVGQVEPHRPGDVEAGDDDAFLNSEIDPEAVFYRDGTPNMGNVQDHPSWVAGTLISTNTAQHRGIVPEAKLYSSGFDPQVGSPQPLTDRQAAISIQNITEQNGGDVRVINLSFVNKTAATNPVLDGNQLLTQFIDWSASTDNVLYVVAGKNTTRTAKSQLGAAVPSPPPFLGRG